MTSLSVNDQTIDSVVQYLNGLLNLRSLTIIYASFGSTKNSLKKIMNTNMVSLTHLNNKNIALGIPISLITLHNLLHSLPKLVAIEVGLMEIQENNDTNKLSIRECSPNLEKLIIVVNKKSYILRPYQNYCKSFYSYTHFCVQHSFLKIIIIKNITTAEHGNI